MVWKTLQFQEEISISCLLLKSAIHRLKPPEIRGGASTPFTARLSPLALYRQGGKIQRNKCVRINTLTAASTECLQQLWVPSQRRKVQPALPPSLLALSSLSYC